MAAAAMIIGKKGIMLKLLQSKSGAKISLDQLPMADGRKRIVLEGTVETVAQVCCALGPMLLLLHDAQHAHACGAHILLHHRCRTVVAVYIR